MDIVQILEIAKIVIILFISGLTLFTVYKTNWQTVTKSANDKLQDRIYDLLKEDEIKNENKGYFNLERIDYYLRSHGGYFMFKWLNPASFLMIKSVLALLTFVLLLLMIKTNIVIVLICSTVGAIAGFFAFDLLIDTSNNEDNDNMLSDIKTIFDTLRTQTKAGVFLTNSLAECYMIVGNDRLKDALLDMTNKITIQNDIEDAVKDFNKKFDNQYIDTLCITILQSMESGKSVQILDDLSKQIADMQSAINIKEQEKLDAKIQVLELLIFVGLVISVLYGLVTQMMMQFTNW